MRPTKTASTTIDQVLMSARPAGGGVPVVPRPGQGVSNREVSMGGYDDDDDEDDLPDEDDEDGDDEDIDVSDFDDEDDSE
jgi:hypothetical protein